MVAKSSDRGRSPDKISNGLNMSANMCIQRRSQGANTQSGLEITNITEFGFRFALVVYQERLGIHSGFVVR